MLGLHRESLASALLISAGVILMLVAAGCSTPAAPDASGDSADAGDDTAPADARPAGDDEPADASCSGRTGAAGDFVWTVQSGGLERSLRLHVPAGYDPARATPVVLNFHGYTSNARQQEGYSRMSDKADESGFIAIHPEGVANSWNAGNCCGGAAQQGVDDVGFVRDLLDAVAAEYCIDSSRIYATGMSNGGFMSHRLACDLSDRLAAIASVAGYNVTQSCTPGRAVPVMHFHGTADGTVSYSGVASTMRDWIMNNACTGDETTSYQNGNTTCVTTGGCRDDASVVLCTIEGGGHTWPGAFGASDGIVATDALWDFLAGHELP